MQVPEGAKVIECLGNYPHLFVRIQVKNDADKSNIPLIQQKIILTAASSKTLSIENPVKFTLETHDVYPQNKKSLPL
jgi:hypothetical protein